MITEENLINLGFKRVDGCVSNDDTPWYCYAMEIGNISLISSVNDEIKYGEWKVHIYQDNVIEYPSDTIIDNVSNLNSFVNILKNSNLINK